MITAKEIQEKIVAANDRLLSGAQAVRARTAKGLQHAERLQRLGFVKSVDTRVVKEHAEARAMDELHAHYARKYPGLKFIDESAMTTVCTQYGLVLSYPDRYKGSVPPWAAKDIEANMHLVRPYRPLRGRWGRLLQKKVPFLMELGTIVWADGAACSIQLNIWQECEAMKLSDGKRIPLNGKYTPVAPDHAVLMIAAPVGDMDLRLGERVEKGRIVAKDDPIVCLHVAGGFVVLTAWGAEGKDPQVFNALSN